LNDAIFLPKIAGKKKMAPGTVKQAQSTVKRTVKANHRQPNRDERTQVLNIRFKRTGGILKFLVSHCAK
jgi:hypothetical protein